MTSEAITAPIGAVQLGGKIYPLRFDHEQIRQTELCWQVLTGNVMGYLSIIAQARRDVYVALCALCYGAIASAQAHDGVPHKDRLTLLRFDRIADYFAIIDAGGAMVKRAEDALPGAKAGEAKNA